MSSEYLNNKKVPWQTRTPQQADAFTDGLVPVSPDGRERRTGTNLRRF